MSKISYQFYSLKFYFGGIFFLILLFIFFWLPSAQIKLFLNSEPLIVNFKIKLDCNENKIFFNLNTIPAKLIDKSPNQQNEQLWANYRFIDGLGSKDKNKIIIFRKDDLKKILDYNVKKIIGEDWTVLYPNKKYQIKILSQDIAKGRALIEVFLDNEIIKKYDKESLKEKINFKNLKDTKKYFNEMPGIKNVEIKMTPAFSKRLPIFTNRIQIKLMDAVRPRP